MLLQFLCTCIRVKGNFDKVLQGNGVCVLWKHVLVVVLRLRFLYYEKSYRDVSFKEYFANFGMQVEQMYPFSHFIEKTDNGKYINCDKFMSCVYSCYNQIWGSLPY